MQKRIFIFVFSLLLLTVCKITAQDAHFSQFYANPLYLNPAFAGTNLGPRIALNFRDQWVSMPSTYMTYTASYDQHFDKLSGGVGVILMGDREGQGIINTYSAAFMYAFRLRLHKKFQMRFALQAGYLQKSLDWDKLTFGDMIDAKYGFVYGTDEQRPENLVSHNLDLAAGFVGYTEWLYFGMAVHHFTNPYQGFVTQTTRIPVRWTGHLGAYFDLKRKSKKERRFGDISISPNIIYQHQKTFNYLNTGFYMNFYPFTVGLWLRNGFVKTETIDALIFMCGVQWDFLKLGYSYDITLGKNAGLTGGSHEVSLQFLFANPEKRSRIKDLKCPAFN